MPVLTHPRGPLHHEQWGDGDVILCLPAGAAPGSQWKTVGTALADSCRVLAPDLPGDGRSPRPVDLFDRSVLDLETELVIALAESVGKPIHVVGHSYGGVQALRLTARRPELVRSLLLMEPVAVDLLVVEDGLSRHADMNAMTEACRAALARGDDALLAQHFCGYWLRPVPWEALPPSNRAAIAKNIRKVFRGWEEILALPDQRALYASISAPTLMVRGDVGPACARWVTERLATLIPNAMLQEVPGAGHMLPSTHAPTVVQLIRDHVATWS